MTSSRPEPLLSKFHASPPADATSLREFEAASQFRLPAAYDRFLQHANGGEGFVGSDAYVILWRVEDLIRFNEGYEVGEYAPGLLLFGSNSGGEAFAFDRRAAATPIVSVPFVGLDVSLARPVASDFDAFLGPSRDGERAASSSEARRTPDDGPAGLEIFEIRPVILGGSPTDPANKVLLTREKHMAAVRYWNKVVADLRRQRSAGGGTGPGARSR